MLAAQFGHRALVTNLVQRGVDFSRENENDMTAIFVAIEADQLSLARSFIEHGATPVEKEAYPYLTAMNYYLTAKYGGELAAGPNLEDFYRSASRLFGMAGTNCEEVIKGKGRQKAGKHALSALYIGGSAVLLATVGGAPIPFIESTNRQKDIIKANAERLKRCDQLKAQCEEIVACLGNGSDTGRPASCMRDDLTLSFGK
jgi:ankyrin repeat protein